ncbi:hypothetical protein Fcan01_11228 [Folsomia candida]|uniref:Uncharacterized protein n=1 Tax=Folsomia candida TaxID=158441 RepID=A0A226EBB3_FOLCA|nr:hypothetical protein Fcan01_27739 [Folsomia candida]OXA54071.1 hypothetical protein Fcan01_11228 [Folsomia candida]
MFAYAYYKPFYDAIWKRMENPSRPARWSDAPKNSDVDKDSAWSLAWVCEGFAEVRREILSIKLQPDVELLVGSFPYISHGKDNMFPDTEALAVANTAVLAPFGRKDFFNGTRVELNLRRITQDCIDHINGKYRGKNPFKFDSFPLQLRKGSEGVEITDYYQTLGITHPTDFNSRAVRDFYFSTHIYVFMRGFRLLTLSVCTSALCMTTCTDYVDAPDDPKMGGREAYAKAVVDFG